MQINASNIGNLLSIDSPYVHSNIFLFNDSIVPMLPRGADGELNKSLQKNIGLYNKIIKLLKGYEEELYSFCNVSNYQELNQKLFGNSSYAQTAMDQIAYQVLRRPNFIMRLVPQVSQSTVNKIQSEFNDSKTIQSIIDEIFKEGAPSLSIFLTKFGKKFATYLGNNNYNTKKNIVNLMGDNDLKKSLEEMTKNWKDNINTSAKSKNSHYSQIVKKIAESAIKNQSINQVAFKENYKIEFREELKNFKQQMILSNESIEALSEEYANKYYNLLSTNFPLHLSNILGEIGERGFNQQITNNTSINLQVFDSGKFSENKIAEQFNGKGIEKVSMKSIHDPNTESQSDEILSFYNNGQTKLVRVQSKNSLLNFLYQTNQQMQQIRPMFVNLEEKKVLDLLNSLNENGLINEEEAKKVSYLIANICWFYNAVSINKVRKGDKHKTRTASKGLGGAQEAVNALLSKSFLAILGIDLDVILEDKVFGQNITTSNVFYYLGNRGLLPTSKILEEIVKQLTEFSNELLGIKYSVDYKKAKAGISAPALYKKKMQAIQGKPASLEYSDEELLQVGKEQGRSIMDKVAGKVQMRFNIDKILRQSSFEFNLS